MPTQEEKKNLEVVAKYFAEYWGKANQNIVDELCDDKFVINYPMHGPSGPYVVGRWIGGGTHTGVAFSDLAVGCLDKPKTGKKMYFSGTTIFTLKDGKIIDETGEEGTIAAMQNLGMVAQPNPGKEVQYLHDH